MWLKKSGQSKIFIIITAFLILATFFWYGRNQNWFKEKRRQTAGIFEQGRNLKELAAIAPSFLGYERPKIYLFLFLNDAELRPGGGFIGSYALLKIEKGKVTDFETNGSENLDWAAPADFIVEPPAPIKKYLGQPRWYFRDSNWSPDFRESGRQALWFYRFEGGREGSKIDGVIGVTASAVEELFKIVGSVAVGDKIFNLDNFREELQYQVEIGYRQEGKTRRERKVLIGDLGKALLAKTQDLPLEKWKELYFLISRAFEEKQLMVYSTEKALEETLIRQGWAGDIKGKNNDFLMVVDANMISFKSDPKVKRAIHYELKPEGDRWRARATIVYRHEGEKEDWKTKYYRNYVRLYVPAGSQLIKSEGFVETDKIEKGKTIQEIAAKTDQDLGKTVFGGFFYVDLGETKTVALEYYLPRDAAIQIEKGAYTLFVQKQLGAAAHDLTVNLDFGKKIKLTGETVFRQETDLKTDREFKISF